MQPFFEKSVLGYGDFFLGGNKSIISDAKRRSRHFRENSESARVRDLDGDRSEDMGLALCDLSTGWNFDMKSRTELIFDVVRLTA